MEDMLQAAVEQGLAGICFTDHCDLIHFEQPGVRVENCYELWARGYEEIEKVRAAWGDKLEILQGMELSEIVQDQERACEIAKAPGLDYLLGAVHAVTDVKDFAFLDYQDHGINQALMERYFDENIRMAEINLMDAVAHVGYPNRYIFDQGQRRIDPMEYGDKLSRLFQILIQNGKGIEVNTSGLRQGIGSFPNLAVLKRYRELGGEIVTTGSDAHRAQDVGSHLQEAQELLLAAGFRYMTVFRQRKPHFIKL